MDVKLWDMNDQLYPNKYTYKNHTEFVVGVDVSMFKPKQIASVSWDGRVLVWNYDDLSKF
jgi:WD40 repeat protein